MNTEKVSKFNENTQEVEVTDEIIDGTKLSLNEWLKVLFSKKVSRLSPNKCFPTDKMRDEYLSTIHDRTEEEVRSLLRWFLIRSGYLGLDQLRIEWIKKTWDRSTLIRKIKTIEYFRRLLSKNETAWEGLTWILDLLPHHPKDAINVIDSYWLVHCQLLPDHILYGLSECGMIIRSKYCEKLHPRETLLELKAKEFEWLVEDLYKHMNYSTKLTKDTHDGGIDIIAEKTEAGQKEKIFIQCKKYKSNIGVKELRSLLGVVSDKKATKGALVCCSTFTPQAKKMAKQNSRIEIINYIDLVKLLNEYLGAHWDITMNNIFLHKKGIPIELKNDC